MVNGMGYWVLFFSHIHPLLKAKTEKMCRKTKGRERKRSRSRQHAHASTNMGHGAHHGQPVVALAWSGPDASRTLHFGALLVRGFLPWSNRIGPIELLLLTSLIF